MSAPSGGEGKGELSAHQPCKNQGPESGPPKYPHLLSPGTCEETGLANPKTDNFHNLGQQQDNQEEIQSGSSIDSIAETRGLESDQ